MSEQSPTSSTARSELTRLAHSLRAPEADLARSPAALRVARYAERVGLFLFDYELRAQLELPEAWLPSDRPDLGVTGEPPRWERGRLAESKYLSFRHDTLLGSLHAGHRAKWTAHELCHGLVGFAWRRDGSALFNALAARVAEALPVALWYFLDEAGVVRCSRHRHQRELGPGHCARCEDAAGAAPGTVEDPDWIARGLDFLERELDAARRSLRTGRPIFTPHGVIDLMSDGLAYASAHGPRLASLGFSCWVDHMFGSRRGPDEGCFDDLDDLIDHVSSVARIVTSRAVGDAGVGVGARWRYIAQDLGARLVQIAADCDEASAERLDRIVARLGASADEASVVAAIDAYTRLFEEIELPPPDEVFATGYPLPWGHGFAVGQLLAGLESALSETLRRIPEADRASAARGFAAGHPPSRAPLARRFAAHLAADHDARLAGLAALEAAVVCARPPDSVELALAGEAVPGETLELAFGVEIVRAGFDAGGLLLQGHADPDGPGSFLVRRDAGDEVFVASLPEVLADRLQAGAIDAYDVAGDAEIAALFAAGVLVPDWSERR